MFKHYLVAVGLVLSLIGGVMANDAAPGILEGHLKIFSPKPVELGDPKEQVAGDTYSQYPLVILSSDGKREIARVTPDKNGNYRLQLQPGDYVLDLPGRAPARVRAKPRTFTIISNQISRVDMDMDTGIR